MKGDFTRVTFKPENHYSGVRMQQGRVQLDADFNEYVDIQAHQVHTAHGDMVGLCGGPQGRDSEGKPLAGFKIEIKKGSELRVAKGRYYVDGVLCEKEETKSITDQPDLPADTLIDVVSPSTASMEEGIYLAYLDVWQRHLTALEDDAIRDVALGGPDTTTRTRTVWQVKLMHVPDREKGPINCAVEPEAWEKATARSSGRLRARAEPETTGTHPCEVPARAGYRGLENQLYRVEVHRVVSDKEITIKWSRENGSVVAKWDKQDSRDADKLTLGSAGRDGVLGFTPDDWIELTDDARELHGGPGLLVQIKKVDGKVLTIDPGTQTVDIKEFAVTRKVRRWDMPGDTGEISVNPAEAENWIPLEKGIEVAFESGTFRTGDYWLIPARTATRDIEWPRADKVALHQFPHGIHHHYCRLALLRFGGNTWTRIHDCRRLFPPLTEMVRFFCIGGDGQEAMPGNPLPKPLQVGVVNGQMPVANATILFEVSEGNGRLQASTAASCSTFTGGVTTPIEVNTGPDGIAACCWRLDDDTLSQQVEATLKEIDGKPMVDGHGDSLLTPIRFNANLSVADQVHYNSERCINPENPETVQDALDQLCRNAALYYVSGDGQEAMPGEMLPCPLQVRVANGKWPVEGAEVVFSIAEPAGGRLEAGGVTAESVPVKTDKNGLAVCQWQLDGKNESQQVEAFLTDAEKLPIRFNANLSKASQVAYNPRQCSILAEVGVNTVQDAIDQLCNLGGAEEPGIHIEKVYLRNGPDLKNDTQVSVNALAEGIIVECDNSIAPESVNSKPVCFVTLELPYPLTQQSDSETPLIIGYRPLKLNAKVSLQGEMNNIFWKPDSAPINWLQANIFKTLPEVQVLAHLTLKGNFIWARDNPELYLDGEVFGIPQNNAITGLRLPSGNGRQGGDFEMWFWLVGNLP